MTSIPVLTNTNPQSNLMARTPINALLTVVVASHLIAMIRALDAAAHSRQSIYGGHCKTVQVSRGGRGSWPHNTWLPGNSKHHRYFTLNSSKQSLQSMISLPETPPNSHRVVFMRHGESEFNNANVFTGWCDIALTQRGIVEAMEAGQVFASHRMHFRKCYASVLTRSIVTAHRCLEAAGVAHTPLQYDWRLNERHYGSLQGLSKERTAERLGRKRVMEWRRSYSARPPIMTDKHPHYEIIYDDPRYRTLDQSKLPLGESLEECQNRVVESWNDIVDELQGESIKNNSGDTLLVAHANSLRALIMHLDDIPSEDIEELNIPTAIPFFYDICLSSGRVISEQVVGGSFRGEYISDDRKKRSFLERRRAANDPFLWYVE